MFTMTKESIAELLSNPVIIVELKDPKEPSIEEYNKFIDKWEFRFRKLLNDKSYPLERHIWVTLNNETLVDNMHHWMYTGLTILALYVENKVDAIHNAITWLCQPISFTSEYTKSQFNITYSDDDIRSLSITTDSNDIELLMIEDFIDGLLNLVGCEFGGWACKYDSSLQETKIYNSAVCGDDYVKFYERLFDYKNNTNDYYMMLKLVSEPSALEREKMLMRFAINTYHISSRINDMFFYHDYDGKLYGNEQYIHKIKDLMDNNKNTIRKLLFKKASDSEFINLYDYLYDTFADYAEKEDKYALYNDLLDIQHVSFIYKTDDCVLLLYPFTDYTPEDLSEDDYTLRSLFNTLSMLFRELHTDENKPKYNYII